MHPEARKHYKFNAKNASPASAGITKNTINEVKSEYELLLFLI